MKTMECRGSGDSFCFSAGFFLLAATVLTFAAGAVTLLLGGSVEWYVFPLATVLAATVTWLLYPGPESVKAVLVASVVIAAAIPLCALLEDASFDGNAYHQKAVALMLGGWNPYYMPLPTPLYDPFVAHYAIGMEIISAAISASVGYIEAGKTVNFMIIMSVALLGYDFMSSRFGFTRSRRLWITVMAVGNPVCMSQLLTYYNDFPKYCLLLVTVMAAVTIASPRSRKEMYVWTGVLSAAIIMSAAVKFNAFFEQGIAVGAFCIWLAVRRRWHTLRSVIAVSAVAAAGSFAVLCYHPYVTNWIYMGNPVYPLMGSGAIDIMTYNTPYAVDGMDRFSAFVRSLCEIKIPYYAEPLGGFGPLMAVMLLLSAVIGVALRRSNISAYYYIGAWVAASCFIFPQSWWARYVSQLWLIPVLAVLSAASESRVRWIKHLQTAVMACGVVTALATAMMAVRISYPMTVKRQLLYGLTRDTGASIWNASIESMRHFTEREIPVMEIPVECLDSCAIMFFGDDSRWSYPVVNLDSARYERFRLNGGRFGLNPERHRYFVITDNTEK